MEELKVMLGDEIYEEYINFIEENRIERIKFESETHHILPKCVFPQYADLSIHTWNSVNLSYRNHFIAHYILAKSGIDSLCVAFFINNLYKDFSIDDEDYLINYENIKRIAVKKNSESVSKWRASLSDEENEILNKKNSDGVKSFLKNADENFFKNRTNKLLKTLSERTENEWEEITQKRASTRLANNPNSYRDASLKASETCKNTILENGLSIKDNAVIKMLETRFSNDSYFTGMIKGRNTMYNKKDENGLNGYQQAYWKGRESVDTKAISLKAAETMNNTILENGLSIKENRIKKTHEKLSIIDENGLSGYQRAALNRSHDTRIFYKINIFDANNELYVSFDKIQMSELIEISELPIKTMWSGEIYTISKNTRKHNKQYDGFYLIKERLKNN